MGGGELFEWVCLLFLRLTVTDRRLTNLSQADGDGLSVITLFAGDAPTQVDVAEEHSPVQAELLELPEDFLDQDLPLSSKVNKCTGHEHPDLSLLSPAGSGFGIT